MAMSVAETCKYVEYFLTPFHTLCLSANHGVGKSSVVKRDIRRIIAKKHNKKLEDVIVIDRRASQLDPSDLIGGQWNVGGQTFNAPPYWIPVHKEDQQWLTERLEAANREWKPFQDVDNKIYIIFLDEVNRGSKLVQQALFELILDHSIHGIRVPDNCYIISAINGNMDLYDAPRQDPAWTDRLVMIDFYPTEDEYLRFLGEAADAGLIHPSIPSYLFKFKDHIDPDDKLIKTNAIKAVKGHSRRSWYRLGEAVQNSLNLGWDVIKDTIDSVENAQQFLQKAASGHVGSAMAASYSEYVASEYKLLSAPDILDKFDETTKKALEQMSVGNAISLAGLNDALVQELAKRVGKKLSDKVCKNILQYLETVPREVVTGFWSSWGAGETRAQAIDWHKTPRRMSRVSFCSSVEKAYDSWLAGMTKKYPNFDVNSDERLS